MPSRTAVVASLVLALGALPSAAVAGGHRPAPPRPDLKVTAGNLASPAASISGSVTIKNAGKGKARSSTAQVRVDSGTPTSLRTKGLKKGKSVQLTFALSAAPGTHTVTVCADSDGKVKEKKEQNNCRALGSVVVASPTSPTNPTKPTNPIPYVDNTVFKVGASPAEYWLDVPSAYDDSHQTPTGLVVFLHGCGDTGQNQAVTIKNSVPDLASKGYLVMTPGLGRDGDCFNATSDQANVLAAIADVKTHFNIAPKKVVIGGYSAGGDLAARTAFAHATSFAGLVVMVGWVFMGSTQRNAEIAAAGWKLNIVFRTHLSDTTYLIVHAREDRDALVAAGFPITYSEIAGTHDYGSDDLAYVFAQLSPSWTAP